MKRNILFGLSVLVVVIALIFWVGLSTVSVEKETSGFVTEAAKAITQSWNVNELISRAEPGLIKAMASQGQSAEQLFATYATLGARKEPMDCRFKNSATLGNGDKTYVTASYECRGEFETGPAVMELTVRRLNQESDWRIYYIKVASEHFKNN